MITARPRGALFCCRRRQARLGPPWSKPQARRSSDPSRPARRDHKGLLWHRRGKATRLRADATSAFPRTLHDRSRIAQAGDPVACGGAGAAFSGRRAGRRRDATSRRSITVLVDRPGDGGTPPAGGAPPCWSKGRRSGRCRATTPVPRWSGGCPAGSWPGCAGCSGSKGKQSARPWLERAPMSAECGGAGPTRLPATPAAAARPRASPSRARMRAPPVAARFAVGGRAEGPESRLNPEESGMAKGEGIRGRRYEIRWSRRLAWADCDHTGRSRWRPQASSPAHPREGAAGIARARFAAWRAGRGQGLQPGAALQREAEIAARARGTGLPATLPTRGARLQTVRRRRGAGGPYPASTSAAWPASANAASTASAVRSMSASAKLGSIRNISAVSPSARATGRRRAGTMSVPANAFSR